MNASDSDYEIDDLDNTTTALETTSQESQSNITEKVIQESDENL